MSDARKMNQAITGYLKQILGGTVRDSHIHALALMITGLVRGKSSDFEKIGAHSGASAETLAQTQSWYRRRFKIEALFADVKSRGFGLDKSGIRHPERLARFVIALFLAYIWLIYWGVLVIQDKKLGLIARTDRFMHSLFQLGRLYLIRILEDGEPIPVSLQLPHPDSFVHLVLV